MTTEFRYGQNVVVKDGFYTGTGGIVTATRTIFHQGPIEQYEVLLVRRPLPPKAVWFCQDSLGEP